MDRTQILNDFDSGSSIEHCVQTLIEDSPEPLRLATALVRAAMEMPDQSGAGVRTTVHSAEPGSVRVGEGVICIVGSAADASPSQAALSPEAVTVVLTLRDPDYPAPRAKVSNSVSAFVATSVMLRAAGRRDVERKWLAGAPLA